MHRGCDVLVHMVFEIIEVRKKEDVEDQCIGEDEEERIGEDEKDQHIRSHVDISICRAGSFSRSWKP